MNELFLACVLLLNGTTGIVVSKDTYMEEQDKYIVVVQTKDGISWSWVDEAKPVPCSEIDFPNMSEDEVMKLLLEYHRETCKAFEKLEEVQ